MENLKNKILIVQTAFIGDVILTIPLVKSIKKYFKESKIYFLLKPDSLNLLEGIPEISELITYDKKTKEKGIKPFIKIIKKIKSEKFDTAVIPHRSFRSALICKLAGIPERIGFDTSAGAFLLTEKVPYKKNVHEIDRNLSLLSAFGIIEKGSIPEISVSPEDKSFIDEKFNKLKITETENFVTIAPGSEWNTKRWLLEGYVSLIKLLWKKKSVPSFLIGGKKDLMICNRIQNLTGIPIVNFCGKLTLKQSGEVIRRSKVLISNDSGAVHLAVGSGKKVVVIYGPTSPEFGFYPYGEGHTILKENIYCSPCSIHGGKKCKEKHFKCMKNITPERVFNAVLKYL
ncbi:lipopolysaccharide heptosyltransferase II [candidate division KSB1 bacterium]|nr:MAG: lipopolysaccharide heptosyltransferase II [candidate division KSB1 bacterium]